MTILSPFVSAHHSNRKILIVDDDQNNLDLLEILLSCDEYSLLKANNGKDAIHIALNEHPDLIIMDVNMPMIDGITACKTIKEQCHDYFIPIILITSQNDTEIEVRGFDSGADEYIVKPPKKPELLARVRAMLRIRELYAALIDAKKQNQQDLDEVGDIQRSFLPSSFPEHPSVEFGHFYGPCSSAGGDYFDLIEIGKSHWGLLIADVTGHGAPAAVVMAITHTLMHSFMNSFQNPSTVLKVANEKLNAHLAPTFYVTMFYSVLNLKTMTLRYSSAGHGPMLLYRSASKSVEWLHTEFGFPLKLVVNNDFDEKETTIGPGDKLILFTDGINERRDKNRNFVSDNRLEAWTIEFGELPAQKFVDTIISHLKQLNPSQPFEDDVTMFVLHRST